MDVVSGWKSFGLGACALATLLLAGCAGEPAPTQASAPSTVQLLTHDSFVVSQDLIDDFEKSTGLKLEVVTGGDAGSMVSSAVLAAGAPSADVMFGVDNTLLARAVAGGVFEPYESPQLASLPADLASNTAGGLVTPIDFGDVCVNIDDTYFVDNDLAPPASLDDLIKPEYRDLLVVQDPGTSSPGLAFLLATIATYGDAWPEYWSSLRDNGVEVSGSWTDAYVGRFSGGGSTGNRPLVVSYATSPPAEIVYAEEPKPTKPSTSVMTEGCYRQVEYAGILAGSPNAEAGKKVVDWLLSPEVQADLPLSMFVFPAREDIELPRVFSDFAAQVPNPLQLDPEQVATSLPAWLETWGTVMGR